MNGELKREYYRAAGDRWIEGVRLQVRRCLRERDGDAFFDSNFLVVAVARLREVARMARKRLGVSDLSDAIDRFDAAHPEFRDVRDYQEHILDPALIGSSMYFAGGALVRLSGDGRAETLIDPPRLLADAETLYESIRDALGPLPEPKDMWIIRPPNKQRR